MSLFSFFLIYLFGGLTFIPFWIIASVYLFKLTTTKVAPSDAQSDTGASSSDLTSPETTSGISVPPSPSPSSSRTGWVTFRRTYDPLPPPPSNPSSTSFNFYRPFSKRSSSPSTSQTAKEQVKLTLKKNFLYVYEDEKEEECLGVLDLRDWEVGLWPILGSGENEGEVFAKRRSIWLKKKTGKETSSSTNSSVSNLTLPDGGSSSVPVPSSSSNTHLHPLPPAHHSLPLSSLPSNPSDPALSLSQSHEFFIFPPSASLKEDWYLSLLLSSFPPSITSPFPSISSSSLQQLLLSIDKPTDSLHSRWLNAFVGRWFLSVHKTKWFEEWFRSRMMKKLNRVKKPGFLSNVNVDSVLVGENFPTFNKLLLQDLSTSTGLFSMSTSISYTGSFSIQLSCLVTLTLPSRISSKPISFPIVLKVTLKKLEGRLILKVKEMPSNRIWFGFGDMPKMELVIEPLLAERKVGWGMITNEVERRIKEVITESFVLPNMDDIPFFDSSPYLYRGGIFYDAERKEKDSLLDKKLPSSNLNTTVEGTEEVEISISPSGDDLTDGITGESEDEVNGVAKGDDGGNFGLRKRKAGTSSGAGVELEELSSASNGSRETKSRTESTRPIPLDLSSISEPPSSTPSASSTPSSIAQSLNSLHPSGTSSSFSLSSWAARLNIPPPSNGTSSSSLLTSQDPEESRTRKRGWFGVGKDRGGSISSMTGLGRPPTVVEEEGVEGKGEAKAVDKLREVLVRQRQGQAAKGKTKEENRLSDMSTDTGAEEGEVFPSISSGGTGRERSSTMGDAVVEERIPVPEGDARVRTKSAPSKHVEVDSGKVPETEVKEISDENEKEREQEVVKQASIPVDTQPGIIVSNSTSEDPLPPPTVISRPSTPSSLPKSSNDSVADSLSVPTHSSIPYTTPSHPAIPSPSGTPVQSPPLPPRRSHTATQSTDRSPSPSLEAESEKATSSVFTNAAKRQALVAAGMSQAKDVMKRWGTTWAERRKEKEGGGGRKSPDGGNDLELMGAERGKEVVTQGVEGGYRDYRAKRMNSAMLNRDGADSGMSSREDLTHSSPSVNSGREKSKDDVSIPELSLPPLSFQPMYRSASSSGVVSEPTSTNISANDREKLMKPVSNRPASIMSNPGSSGGYFQLPSPQPTTALSSSDPITTLPNGRIAGSNIATGPKISSTAVINGNGTPPLLPPRDKKASSSMNRGASAGYGYGKVQMMSIPRIDESHRWAMGSESLKEKEKETPAGSTTMIHGQDTSSQSNRSGETLPVTKEHSNSSSSENSATLTPPSESSSVPPRFSPDPFDIPEIPKPEATASPPETVTTSTESTVSGPGSKGFDSQQPPIGNGVAPKLPPRRKINLEGEMKDNDAN